MREAHAIDIENLEKRYREGFFLRQSPVLRGFSFHVPAGEVFGFLGANGAGKTTTIKLMLGLQMPDRGKISLFGEDPSNASARARIGYLPERPYFQQNLTANEFLDFHRGLFGRYSRSEPRASNSELLKLVGLPGVGGHRLSVFSKGMLQRVGIAQSLVNDPDLVILDEPMSGLDPVGRREVRNLILELNRRGKTVFFSSHILSDIEAICTRIAFLEKGELKYFGRVDELVGRGGREFEILFRPAGEGKLPAILSGAERYGDGYRITVSGSEAARKGAEACWAEGGEVLSLSPLHRSLEEALFSGGKP